MDYHFGICHEWHQNVCYEFMVGSIGQPSHPVAATCGSAMAVFDEEDVNGVDWQRKVKVKQEVRYEQIMKCDNCTMGQGYMQ